MALRMSTLCAAQGLSHGEGLALFRSIVLFSGSRDRNNGERDNFAVVHFGECAIVGELLDKPIPGEQVGVFLRGGDCLDRLKGGEQFGSVLMQIDVTLHTRIGQALVRVGLGGGTVGLADDFHAGVGRLELGQRVKCGGGGVAGGKGKALADGDCVGGKVDFVVVQFDNLHILIKICCVMVCVRPLHLRPWADCCFHFPCHTSDSF